MLLHAIVHAADIQNRDGGVLLLGTLFGLFPFLKKLFADSAYQGPIFQKAVGKILTQLDIEIVKRSDRANGFVVLPKRWIVERTIAWLNRCRRLAKDWENLNVKALALPQSASCSENSVILHDVLGRTLSKLLAWVTKPAKSHEGSKWHKVTDHVVAGEPWGLTAFRRLDHGALDAGVQLRSLDHAIVVAIRLRV